MRILQPQISVNPNATVFRHKDIISSDIGVGTTLNQRNKDEHKHKYKTTGQERQRCSCKERHAKDGRTPAGLGLEEEGFPKEFPRVNNPSYILISSSKTVRINYYCLKPSSLKLFHTLVSGTRGTGHCRPHACIHIQTLIYLSSELWRGF